MISKLFANNFRCLVNFEISFDSFGVLCGPNGSGKSSAFDVLKILRDLASGDAVLGGENERDIKHLEFTNWLDSSIQEFELHLSTGGQQFTYLLHLEQVSHELKPRVLRERATCNKRELFDRNLDGVSFQKGPGAPKTGFPLDWRQAALGSIQPAGNRKEIEELQKAVSRVLILRPSPREMEPESKAEAERPDLFLTNLTSWYRFLSQEQDWIDELRSSLQDVWPDFRSFRLTDVGLRTKALQLRFDSEGDRDRGMVFFDQLSDGEKSLVGLYMVVAALKTGAADSVFIDEPDNFVGLPELQPWVASVMALLDDSTQAILISHHPEILGAAVDQGRYFWRDNHTSPTRVGLLKVPAGLSIGEAVARGWASGQ